MSSQTTKAARNEKTISANKIIKDLRSHFQVSSNGDLVRLISRSNNAQKGQLAGCKDSRGYLKIQFKGQHFYAHQIVYAVKHGIIPKMIDHIDRNPSNNGVSNLRATTPRKNQENSKMSKVNKSGYTGIYLCRNKWRVQLRIKGKRYSLGYFKDKSEAIKVLQDFKKERG